jgi:hypothetical protein
MSALDQKATVLAMSALLPLYPETDIHCEGRMSQKCQQETPALQNKTSGVGAVIALPA